MNAIDTQTQTVDLAALNMQANKAAQKYTGKFARPTAVLGLAVPGSIGAAIALYMMGLLPLIAAFAILFVATFAGYTVVHEAAHGNISGNHKNLVWLNNLMGTINGLVIVVPLSTHRPEHLMHHRHTNNPAHDPDCVRQDELDLGLLGFIRFAARFDFNAIFYGILDHGRGQQVDKATKPKFGAELLVSLGWRIALLTQMPLADGLILIVGSWYLAALTLIYWFAYRPHLPYQTTDRYRNTNSFHVPVWARPFQWFLLGQDLHAIHHLFPRVPFYHYRDLFREIEPALRAHNAPIMGIFDRKPVAAGVI